jgi:integrase/recombinase XerC
MAPAAGRQIRMTIGELRARLADFERPQASTHATETVGTYRRSLKEFERWFLDHGGAFYFREMDVRTYGCTSRRSVV